MFLMLGRDFVSLTSLELSTGQSAFVSSVDCETARAA